jgi:predicted amidohydrolase
VRVATTAIEVVHNKEANAEKIAELAVTAAGQGAELVVFPEAALQGYMYGINHEMSSE